jgi:hypothetical protein
VFVGQKDEMQSRGALFAAPLILLPLQDHAQGPAFVGTWNGDVKGIGPARLIITAVGGDGRVEGRMEFELESFVSTFGDKADTIKNTNRGIVSGFTLVIDSALGGRYELNLGGNQLSGMYTRGTTYQVAVTFTRS